MSKHNTKVLVVDDEPDIRQLIYEILKDEGYQVAMAENAQAASPEILPSATPTMSDVNDGAEKSGTKPADIVSLDSFRK